MARRRPTLAQRVGRLEREREWLLELIDAVRSTDPDSAMTARQVAFRKEVNAALDCVFGSRVEVRERLDAAVDALRFYTEHWDKGERAQATVLFIQHGGR